MTNNEDGLLTDEAVLVALGGRVRRVRLRKDMTQTALAKESGVAKRTIERFEQGASIQLTSLIRILRSLGLLEQLMDVVPDQRDSPMARLLGEKKTRYRASGKSANKAGGGQSGSAWEWDDE